MIGADCTTQNEGKEISDEIRDNLKCIESTLASNWLLSLGNKQVKQTSFWIE